MSKKRQKTPQINNKTRGERRILIRFSVASCYSSVSRFVRNSTASRKANSCSPCFWYQNYYI